MLNTVLEYPLVSQYFHFEENEKFAIYQDELLINRIIKLKDNRFFFIKEINKTTPYIEFTQLTEKKDRQSYIILFVIPYESIKGELELERLNNKWTVKSNKITEN